MAEKFAHPTQLSVIGNLQNCANIASVRISLDSFFSESLQEIEKSS